MLDTTRPIDQAAMPDVAAEISAESRAKLDWVGMDAIEVPVHLATDDGLAPMTPASVSAHVSLIDGRSRGIHMSRLYLEVDEVLSQQPLTPSCLREILGRFMASHHDLGDAARIRVEFDYMLRRPALKSDHSGWRKYPVFLEAEHRHGKVHFAMGAQVLYSSTCPCSAALARQLIQQQFEADFPATESLSHADVLAWLGTEEGICATPHSQRSEADIRVELDAEQLGSFPLLALIDLAEQALQTPVQTAVKREDEQAFALVNGRNLMFCEDAARQLGQALDQVTDYSDFFARVAHLESLHPHDAVAEISKQ